MKRQLPVLLAALLLLGTVPAQAAPTRWVGEPSPEGLTVFTDTYEDGTILGGFLDEAGREVIPAIYSSLHSFEEGYAQVARTEPGTGRALWGVIDTTGREVVPCRYFTVYWGQRRSDGLVMVKNWLHRYGMVDTATGEEAYACTYPSQATLEYALARGVDEPTLLWQSQKGAVEEAGLSVTWYPQYQGITRLYGTDRMVVKGQNGLYALFTLDGQKVTDFMYDAVGEPGQGRIPACRGDKWGALDEAGSTVVPFCYDTVDEARDNVGVYFVGRWPDQPPYALVRLDGTRLTGYDFWTYQPFVNGFARVTDGEKWGYLGTDGKLITAMKYDTGVGDPDFDANGLAVTYQFTRRYNLIDTTGRELLSQPSSVRPWYAGYGLYGYAQDDKVGFVDQMGRVVIPPQYDYQQTPKGMREGGTFLEQEGVYPIYEVQGVHYVNGYGLAQVSRDGEQLFIDTQGNEVTPPQADKPDWESTRRPFYEGLCWVNDKGSSPAWGMGYDGLWGERFMDADGSWGFMDADGEMVVPVLFEAVGQFDRGYASVKLGEVYGLLKNPLRKDDVSDWAEEEVARADELGLIPDDCRSYKTYTVTRAQFAHLAVNYLEKALGETFAPARADTFTDTADEAVLKAYAAGIVIGVGEGRFDPDGPLTREQLATMLWRAMEKAGAGMHIGGMDGYSDWEQVSDWAKNAVNNLVNHGMMQGTGTDTLSPKDSCTVEQAILLVVRAYEKDYPTPAEQADRYQAAKDRVSIRGLAIGTALDELPEELRSALKPVGEPYDGWPGEPGKETAQRYEAEGITVITSRASEEVLRREVENNGDDYLLDLFGTADREAILKRELGREYVDTVILTSDRYELVSGLKVGDSEDRARELGHGREPYTTVAGETVGFFGSTEITLEEGVVTQIQVWDSIGRRVGPFFDP